MIQHISVRVPWHDHGWDGTICQDPSGNTSCLKLQGILQGKKELEEDEICGQCIAGHEGDIPCLGEGSAFMSPEQFVALSTHPYVQYKYDEYMHLLPTENVYPPYSLSCRPFAWLLKENMHQLNEKYGLEIDEDAENTWPRGKSWLQLSDSQEAVFDYFFKDVVKDKSLCLVYAKEVPFVEDFGRVIVGVGLVKNVERGREYKRSNKEGLRSFLWETHVSHSIRPDNSNGFLIPYDRIIAYADEHPEFDLKSVIVMAPDDAFAEFSYATEHVSYDAVIEVLLSCRKVFEILNDILDEDYSDVLVWIDDKLNEVWDERGGFPGLGAMLSASGLKYGVIVAKEFRSKLGDDENVIDKLDDLFSSPERFLSESLSSSIDDVAKITWTNMPDERKTLFKLLSRFELSIDQAKVLFYENHREKQDINLSDEEIINNPYLLYERTREKREALQISVKRIDRAVFPVESIKEKYPLEAPSAVTSERDLRRVKALAIYALENAASEGNSILPAMHMINAVQAIPLDPPCEITSDNLDILGSSFEPEILVKKMKDGSKYYKLDRYVKFDQIIEKKIRKKINSERIEIEADWREYLDDYLEVHGVNRSTEGDEREERARQEKTAALKELAENHISVLVGGAGSGKTTVLAVLCSHEQIEQGGVLLLAPTGKATVRLLESMGGIGQEFEAKNVAQYLSGCDRFNFEDKRYKTSDKKPTKKYETVIIDESSMLTEEMMGALLDAVGNSKRIIFVGDGNQLPPIGAGRPFVDLIKILKHDFGTKLPRVKNGYCELVENCRQASEGGKILDVEFANYFTGEPINRERNIVTEIISGDNERIQFLRWFNKADLEDKLFNVLEDEFGITDKASFDLSLGGNPGQHEEDYSYFNSGIAANVDKWQILAPVKNMPQGVLNLNHLIHTKYRAEEIRLAGKRPKHIASPWGHESIVYGDKVINVRNMRTTAYPKNSGGRDYIANGEIGIACGDYRSSRDFTDNSLRVEFSSQQGFGYFYNYKNFDEEKNTNDLELAYALTVHKAQGSQFDTVVFVLSENCRLLSKEMVYTALTRQKKKIVILYNGDPHKLLDYSAPEYSVVAQRFTDLFSEMPRANGESNLPMIVRVGEKFYEEGLIHKTTKGHMVRSKSEVIVADHLYSHHLDYIYEPEVEIAGRKFRPDFSIQDPDDDDRVVLWEHVGMPNDQKYMEDWNNKLKYYNEHGIIEGKNLIISRDGEDGSLDSYAIDEMIIDMFDL